jgi:hypothetical protein
MIVTAAALTSWLGFTDTDTDRDALLADLLAYVEQAFLNACGRGNMPFTTEADTDDVTVTLPGTGAASVFLPYPVQSLTDVVVGLDQNAPEETLAAADLVWRVGSIVISRTDGGTFGALDAEGVVHVTYRRAADAPADVKIALLRAAAALYYQRGAEDVRAESQGGVRSDLAGPFSDDTWRAAVDAHREYRIG